MLLTCALSIEPCFNLLFSFLTCEVFSSRVRIAMMFTNFQPPPTVLGTPCATQLDRILNIVYLGHHKGTCTMPGWHSG